MTARDFLNDFSKDIESGLKVAVELDRMAEEITPRCGECGEHLTDAEIKERIDNRLNLYDKDTICDNCFTDFLEHKEIDSQDETTTRDFCDDSQQL